MGSIKEKYLHWLAIRLNVWAITIGNTIYYSTLENETDPTTRAHELKHVEQYQQFGIPGYLYRYFKEYISNRIKGQDHWTAFGNISFEIEAYKAEREQNEP